MEYLKKQTTSIFTPFRIGCFLFTMQFCLSGCGTTLIERSGIEYKTANAKKVKPLVLPPDLVRPKADGRFDIPEKKASSFSEYSDTMDKTLALDGVIAAGGEIPTLIENVKIKGEGRFHWIEVDQKAEVLWPRIQKFWENRGFVVEKRIREAGIMETGWGEKKAKPPAGTGIERFLGEALEKVNAYPVRDKFRTRLEKGATENSTAIYLTHQSMYQKRVKLSFDNVSKGWEVGEADSELEVEMLYSLSLWLGLEQEKAINLKQKLQDGSTVRRDLLTKEGEVSFLKLGKSFGSAWRSVGIALDRTGFTLNDRDRDAGLYFVQYTLPKDKPRESIWEKLAFWSKKKTDSPVRYRVLVEDMGEFTEIRVLDQHGGQIVDPVSEQVLNVIKKEL